jgi:hypothetical protein
MWLAKVVSTWVIGCTKAVRIAWTRCLAWQEAFWGFASKKT